MTKILTWLDNNILTLLALFLLVFIPLYPKIPEADILPGYNVRIRLEDFLILFSVLVYGVQLLRRKTKIAWDLPTFGILTYLVIGFVSMLVAILVIKTVPLQYIHIAKTALHWARRIEYFSFFFLFFYLGKSLRQIKITMALFFVTLLGVIVYGFGQKYFSWCAYSTMNREFSKGPCLLLTDHSRVLSTFGGHYDLAAYLVIALSLGWSLFFALKNRLAKVGLAVLLFGGLWLLILTASRISYGSYLIGLTVVIFLWAFRKGLGWAIGRWLVVVTLSLLLMLSFSDLSDRFFRLTRFNDRLSGIAQLFGHTSIKPPSGHPITISDVANKSDQPPTPARPGDVVGNDVPDSVPQIQADGSVKYVPVPRTYSACALKYDLSTCIRLESTWPHAFKSFKQDPLFGTGYATLTKNQIQDFTEAESTDNDYLRSLGETGFLGFASFFGVILIIAYFAFKSLKGLRDPLLYSLAAGFVALTAGILFNAIYIDVFESSKVAYIFWAMAGLTFGTLYVMRDKIKADTGAFKLEFDYKKYLFALKNFFLSDKPWLIIVFAFAIYIRTLALNDLPHSSLFAPVADWHSWRQADTSAVTRDYDRLGINLLYPTYEDISSIASGKENPKALRMVEFPFYNAVSEFLKRSAPELSVEAAGRLTTAAFSALTGIFLFLIARKLFNRRVGYLVLAVFTLLPYNIFYGRAILPDPTMASLAVGAVYFALKFTEKEKFYHLAIATILASFALLVKPVAIFILLPVVYLFFVQFKISKKFLIYCAVFALSAVPLFAWRFWISHFPEGIPASDWLFNGNGIRFKGAFWYWLFADRVGRLILGYWGLVLLGFGLVRKNDAKFGMLPIVFALSSFLYLAVIATGNVQHDYYQILITPSLALLAGIGLDFLIFNKTSSFHHWLARAIGIIAFVFMLAFGFYFVKDYYNINHPEIVQAGQAFQSLNTSRNATVIAPYDGDTAFLYQTDRKGWPIMEGSIDNMVKLGADYYVSTNFDDTTNNILKRSLSPDERKKMRILSDSRFPFTTLAKTSSYVIVQLVPSQSLPQD